jgi:acetylornithine deacetylase/succinyl-diaminopimelate desuccinylase-like protein
LVIRRVIRLKGIEMTTPDGVHAALRESAIHHLQALLRLNTMSPPGNEKIAADHIAGILRDAGIDDVQVLESAPNRANVVARLRSENPSGRPILLMGHTDVVTVEPEKWERDPFGGDLVDGWIWGRGALDMKSQVAAELAVMLALKEQGVPLSRDVIYVAFADEEAGGEFGADWMWKHHRDLIDAEYAINEGGGAPMTIDGHLFYGCQVGEKGSTHLRMTVTGTPGHASVPLDETAFSRLAEALRRLHAWQGETIFTAPVRQMLETIGETVGGDLARHIDGILDAESVAWDDLATLPFNEEELLSLRATTRNTAVPTIIHGGQRINVIPGEIQVDIDGRVLPGEDPEAFRAAVQAAVGDLAEIAIVTPDSGVAADPASPFFDAIQATMAALKPGAVVMPTLTSGGTDAKLLPGIKVFGFFPFEPTERIRICDPLVHGHNERIHVDDLALGTSFIYELVARFAGPRREGESER